MPGLTHQGSSGQRYKRRIQDLSNHTVVMGAIGCLQTLAAVPVVAGDIININLRGVARLSTLRMPMYIDAVQDLFVFYTPLRHIYTNWDDYLLGGVDEAQTLGSAVYTSSLDCLGSHIGAAGTYPDHASHWYPMIWNRYFRAPTDTAGIIANEYFETLAATSQETSYGKGCCYLPADWNVGIDDTVDTSDYQVSAAGAVVSLFDISTQKARLATERRRDYFTQRYSDLLEDTWGGSAGIDADQRPQLLRHAWSHLSGYDVDGTDDANLGQYSAKAINVGGIQVPWRYIPEHGIISIMMLVRFPSIHRHESNRIMVTANPTYQEMACDPRVMASEPPINNNLTQYIRGSSLADAGQVPFGYWWFSHPSYVHSGMGGMSVGFPFIENQFADINDTRYIESTDYDNIFQSLRFKHWQFSGYCQFLARRIAIDPRRSIFAGSK